MRQKPYSVTEITAVIKNLLEEDERLKELWLEGEISNWSRSRSGHCYFTIKDTGASIRAVVWRTLAGRLSFLPEDGQAIVAHGRVSLYEPQGQYQFYVESMEPRGRGALYAQFEALKAQLAEEGLFAMERKRAVPPFPRRIGVVTSPTGAALRDMLNVLGRRWPLAEVFLAPTLVQGEQAPAQIIAALDLVYGRHDIDVIIVGRGGGSIEDLWAFNDEQVARALYRSPVPVIAGVGHETDFTIADFVADVRAPTPSAAAELAVPDQTELRGRVSRHLAALGEAAVTRIKATQRAADHMQRTLARLSPQARLAQYRQRVDGLHQQLDRTSLHRLVLLRERASGLAIRLSLLDPEATLGRGYAIVQTATGAVVRSTRQVASGDPLTVRVADGSFPARVERP
ncbi:MAG TPA: exodeoxyribonuclease VII large subunit [Anaerolineae bacterium]|nr:exodeoxyribonuclease VII large subunit [Anaerolineae bacterium]